MLKHKKKVVILMFFTIIIIATNFYMNASNKEYLIDITDTATLYDILESDGFVYFGSPTCPSCKFFKPLLTEVAKEENIQIYYFDIRYAIDSSLLTEDETIRLLEDYKIVQIPVVIKIVNGSHDSSYGAKFREEQKEEIKEAIRDFVLSSYRLSS